MCLMFFLFFMRQMRTSFSFLFCTLNLGIIDLLHSMGGISCLCILTQIPSHPSHHWSLRLSLSPPLSVSTVATTLFSRQSTLEDLDGMPECIANIPKTSERARPKLRKMYGLDQSNSSMDSGSSFISRCLASASSCTPIPSPDAWKITICLQIRFLLIFGWTIAWLFCNHFPYHIPSKKWKIPRRVHVLTSFWITRF